MGPRLSKTTRINYMTHEEEKALQDDNVHFLPEEKEQYANDALWILGISLISGLILLGIFLWEVINL